MLLIRILDHVSDSCPANQAVLIPRFAIGWKRSLRHVVENFQVALLEMGGERVDPSLIPLIDSVRVAVTILTDLFLGNIER